MHNIGIIPKQQKCVWLLKVRSITVCAFPASLVYRVLYAVQYHNTPLPDIHSPCLVVWVRNMVHNKAPVLSHWCIWHVGTTQDSEDRLPYTRHVTNVEVRATTGCLPLSHLVTDRRLRLFGHNYCPQEDHHGAVAAVIRGVPPDWKRPLGRPSHTWLRAVEADLGQQNIGLASAWRKAVIRDDWRRIVVQTQH